MRQGLERFIRADELYFETALAEIRMGMKRSHWMWYIFPQVKGLGYSETSKYYGIEDLEEAESFLKHPLLGQHLIIISSALLKLPVKNANAIFGSPDDMKLFSSMTLFSLIPTSDPVFQLVLEKYFEGRKDNKTIHLLTKR